MKIPKVSIIVPIYNVEKYLDRCMNSLVNQTLKDIEIIMVDDGSPDNCPKMCDEWAKKDGRIKVVHKKNGGLGFARNSGLDVATGEFVAFVDSDDYVEKNMYEKLLNVAEEHHCDAVFCGFYKDSYATKEAKSEVPKYTEFTKDLDKLALDFVASPPHRKNEYVYEMSVWHSVYRLNLIKEHNIKFVSERTYASEDLPFQLDFIRLSQKIAFIPDCFYHYCYNSNSLTKQFNLRKFEAMCNLFRLLMQKTEKVDPEGYRAKRLFIGYVRMAIRQIALFGQQEISMIKAITSCPIWKELKSYKCSYLPPHSALMHFFVMHKMNKNALILAKVLNHKAITSLKRYFGLLMYYGFAQYLFDSYMGGVGNLSNRIRVFCCKLIFTHCGTNIIINRKAYFGSGKDIEIGDFSSIGANCVLPNNLKIGRYVMMAPDVYIGNNNHKYEDISIPMCMQGKTKNLITIIDDDVWLCTRTLLTPGHHLGKGSIIAAGAVVTHDVEPYSIVGGNPAKLIKARK